MRFLFVAPNYHTNQHFVAKALLDRGHEVRFFVVYVGKSEEHSVLAPEVTSASLPSRLLLGALLRNDAFMKSRDKNNFVSAFTFPSFIELFEKMRSYRPDVVIVREPNHLHSFAATLIARLLAINIVFYTQGAKFFEPKRTRDTVREALLKLFRATWITPVLGDDSPERTTHPKLYYLPFVVEADEQPKHNWFRDGVINILNVGRFDERKNHLLLLKAFKALHPRYNIHLTIVGEYSREPHKAVLTKVERFIKKEGLSDKVCLQLNESFHEVQATYERSDLYVLPSSREPAGVSILEAMAKGLPVICSDSNGTKQYIKEGVNGFVFSSDDVADLTAKLEAIVRDRARLQEMGRQSKRLAQTVHHPEAYHTRLMEMLSTNFDLGDSHET